jgi:chromosome segregation ATPase
LDLPGHREAPFTIPRLSTRTVREKVSTSKGQIQTLLKAISDVIGSLPLKESDREEMEGEVEMTETELKSDKSKAGIIRTCLRSMASKMAAAMASPLTAEVTRQTQAIIDGIHTYLGGS